MTKQTHLLNLKKQLKELQRKSKRKRSTYVIPALWSAKKIKKSTAGTITVNPTEFFITSVNDILRQPKTKIKKGPGGSWTRDAVIYNMFVRSTCAFDHDRNGKLDLPINSNGWRETGTFLKAIALLPYIKSLGVNTIHLLPITSIGSDGNKGTLGSPYAIKNPYELDPNLSEPNLGIGVEEEFKTLVEGAHHLGIRVVVEFVFRTSAKDGDWVKEHPEWFYWINANVEDRSPGELNEGKYGNPMFTDEELKNIFSAVEHGRLENLLPPHETYRNMFIPPPEIIKKENGRWIGLLPGGTHARIPGAFADWPPQDTQPPWGDVTYLKLYDHPDFNYIAYNTIRMYDRRLAQAKNVNASLWEAISEIIPHYQRAFGIDGVMIDMGHALPMELKREMIHRARAIDPEFAFWDENFSISGQSVDEGYNAVIGYQWADQHHPDKLKNLLRRFGTEGFPLPFFATAESHNTPRAAARHGGTRYAKYAWATSNFLPALPFIHSGFEIGESYPINTGLDFSTEDLQYYPSERLPLFSEYAYGWTNKEQFTEWIAKVSAVRRKYQPLVVDAAPESFRYIECEQADIIAFMRTKKGMGKKLLLVANSNMDEARTFDINYRIKKRSVPDLLSKKKFKVKDSIMEDTLAAGQVAVFEL